MQAPPAYSEKPQDPYAPPPGQPYPPQQPGYPPQQPGYPPTSQPGYPPTSQPGYAPPPGAYPPPQQAGYQQQYAPPPGPPPMATNQAVHQQTTVITTQPTTQVLAVSFGEMPTSCTCPHCQAQIVTAVHYEAGSLAWIICCVLLFVFWPLMCLPFCLTSLQDAVHTCPNCKRQVGAFRR